VAAVADEQFEAEDGDRFDPLLIGAIGDVLGHRAAIDQTELSLSAVSERPLPTGL